MEVTEVIIDFVNTEIRRIKMEMSDDLSRTNDETAKRFEKLIREELTYEDGDLFGKDEMYIQEEEPKKSSASQDD